MSNSSTSDAFTVYKHFDNVGGALERLQNFIGNLDGLRILEAGCGSASYLDTSKSDVTGIDVSQAQLERNDKLSTKICADLHDYENEGWNNYFDLIVCWDVIEHLENPKFVLEKFMRWIKTQGRILLVYPNPQTLKGRVTKYSPFFLHQIFYKISLGKSLKASRDGTGPFRTVFASDIELMKLLEQLQSGGFSVELLLSLESFQNQFVKKYLPAMIVDGLNRAFLGKLRSHIDKSATDLILVARKTD